MKPCGTSSVALSFFVMVGLSGPTLVLARDSAVNEGPKKAEEKAAEKAGEKADASSAPQLAEALQGLSAVGKAEARLREGGRVGVVDGSKVESEARGARSADLQPAAVLVDSTSDADDRLGGGGIAGALATLAGGQPAR